MAEQGGHVCSEVFVVLVDGGQPGRDVVVPADLDAGEDRGDDVVPEGEQGRYGPGGRAGQIVAAGARGFADELLAAEFAQVVGGLAGVVGGVGLPGHGVDLGGHIGHGEPSGDAARASTAARAARIRGLFTSMPPARLAPNCAGSGS